MHRLLCLTLVLVSLGAIGAEGAKQEKAALHVTWARPSVTLDPILASNLNDARVLAALFEGLVTFAADHVTPAPGAAEKWEVSPDGLEYTFTLRAAKWSDGEAVVAADFVSAWTRGIDSSYASLFEVFKNVAAFRRGREADGDLAQYETLGPAERRGAAKRLAASACKRHVSTLQALVKREKDDEARKPLEAAANADRPDVTEKDFGFRAPDAKTVKCALERPTPWFLDLTGFVAFYPVSSKTRDWTEPTKVVTNGPYAVASWDRVQTSLTRVRGEGPANVVLEWREPEEAIRLYDAGKLDWLDADSIPPGKLAEVNTKHRNEFQYFDLWATAFIRANAKREPFSKLNVRRAFARATDRRGVGQAVKCNPGESLVPPGFPGYVSPDGLKYDIAKAFESLLKDYPDTSTFPKVELLAMDSPRDRLAAGALRDQWEKDLGIRVRARFMKPRAYAATLMGGEYDLALGGWAGDVFDPITFLELWTKDAPLNLSGWSSPEFEKKLAAARTETDAKRRPAALAEAEKILLEDAAVIPLYSLGSYQLVSPRVKGVVPNLMGRVLLQHVRM